MSGEIELMTQLLQSIPNVVYVFIFFGGFIIGYIFNELLTFLINATRYLKIKLSQIKEK